MKIKHAEIVSSFQLTASRNELEIMRIAVHHVYHYKHEKIGHLKSTASALMDSLDEILDVDRDIRHRAGQAKVPEHLSLDK